MNDGRYARPLYGLVAGALLIAGIVSAGGARAQDGGGPLIEADVDATVEITGGDARGGDAVGGDAGLIVSITDADAPGGGAQAIALSGGIGGLNASFPDADGASTTISQQVGVIQGGTAVGGDARGGTGLDADIDADVVVDADIALEVAADVSVNTVAGADLSLADVPGIGTLERTAAQPARGNQTRGACRSDRRRGTRIGGGIAEHRPQ